jgi:hypothetical protein
MRTKNAWRCKRVRKDAVISRHHVASFTVWSSKRFRRAFSAGASIYESFLGLAKSHPRLY